MEVWATKLISLIVLLLVAIVSGLLPLKLLSMMGRVDVRRRSKGKTFVDCLNCFAGGVFFATSMLHLLPDVRHDVASVLETLNWKSKFAFAELLASVGVFVGIFLEQAIVYCRHRHLRAMRSSRSGESVELLFVDNCEAVETEEVTATSLDDLKTDQCSAADDPTADDSSAMTRAVHDDIVASKHVTRSMVLLLALSTHTIFEGLALGLQSSAKDVWTLFTAILLHKLVMSFAAGFRFAESFRYVYHTVFCVLAFAAMTPTGVAMGLAVTESGNRGLATSISSVLLQGVATGTFIYVTFFEILMEQMTQHPNIFKVISVLIGYACIAALVVVSNDTN